MVHAAVPARRPGARRLLLAGGLVVLAGTGPWPEVQTPVRTGAQAPADAALVVAVEQYQAIAPATFAGRDGEAAWNWLVHTRGVPYASAQRLTGPTASGLEAALDRAAAQVGEGGVLWWFWSGHAARSPATGDVLLLASDAPPGAGHLDHGGVSLAWAAERLTASRAAAIVIVLDTSLAGVDREGRSLYEAAFVGPPPRLLERGFDPRLILWVGATKGAPAVHEPARQGLFTWTVLGGLRGWADGHGGPRDDVVTLDEVRSWVPYAFQRMGRAEQGPDLAVGSRLGSLVLASGRLQNEPDLLAPDPLGPAPEVDAPDGVDPELDAFRAAFRADVEAVHAAVQKSADQEWPLVLRRALTRTPEGMEALRRFLDRYDVRTYVLAGGDVVVTANQVPEARALLRGGGVWPTPRLATVRIEPDTFAMGSAAVGEARHEVTVTRPFLLGAHEVTQKLWTATMGTNPSELRGEELPVTNVTWSDAIAFCNALSRADGLTPAYAYRGQGVAWDAAADGWRLPTEAEWELAAGPSAWSGFDSDDEACGRANLLDRAADETRPCDDGDATLARVGRRPSLGTGLYDLTGNAAEWVFDTWAPHPTTAVTDPVVLVGGGQRVVKGGSYLSLPETARTAARAAVALTTTRSDLGLRVACNAPLTGVRAVEAAP